MKNAVLCVAIGNKTKLYSLCIKTTKQYANKIGAEFILLEEPYFKIDWEVEERFQSNKQARYAWVQKLYAITLLEKYDRVLLIDADIIVTPNSPDIFAAYPDTSKQYALFESLYYKKPIPDINKIEKTLGELNNWPYHGNVKQYLNAGVILFSRNETLTQYFSLHDVKKIFNILDYIEQTYLNYLFFKHQIPIEPLDPKFNWIPWLSDKRKRHQAYFMHHAVAGFGRSTALKLNTFFNDYARHYHNPIHRIVGNSFRNLSSILILIKHNIKKLFKKGKK